MNYFSNQSLSASIVTFQNKAESLKATIESALNSKVLNKLFVIDNSPTNSLECLFRVTYTDPRIEYIFNGKNLGFGKAHNIAMQGSIESGFKYHVVLNPDVYFEENILSKIVEFMDSKLNVGQVMPKILYPNGEVQYLCKLLPSPVDLFLRRFMSGSKLAKKRNELYELRFSGYNKTMNIPYLSGCFMFFRNNALQELGLFDENIFMYIEDCDITRRIHKKYQTLFWPEAIVHHHYAKGSYKNWRLMLYNLHGAFVYFNKYGWFSDSERDKINQRVLEELGFNSNI
ncbi:MAG: glycosyltransferase family 2 protein [Candidatus Caenarcaniphilales bacterium]|nr:glycosyltransferase family 2 protein [Candidatus Caenarcaniphilales bacterium]